MFRARCLAWLVVFGAVILAGCDANRFGETADRTQDVNRILAEGRARAGVGEIELIRYQRGSMTSGPDRFKVTVDFEPAANPEQFCTFPTWFVDQGVAAGFRPEALELELERPPAGTAGSTAWWTTSIGGISMPLYVAATSEPRCRAAGQAAGTVGATVVYMMPPGRKGNSRDDHIIVSLRHQSYYQRVKAQLRKTVPDYDAYNWRFDG